MPARALARTENRGSTSFERMMRRSEDLAATRRRRSTFLSRAAAAHDDR